MGEKVKMQHKNKGLGFFFVFCFLLFFPLNISIILLFFQLYVTQLKTEKKSITWEVLP